MHEPSCYEEEDISRQSLPFGSPYFPAYFRLLKWKILDVCVSTMKFKDIGDFALFEDCFPPGKLEEVVKKITGEAEPFTQDPEFKKLKETEVDPKFKRHAETYLKLRHDHKTKVERRRFAEYFLNKILFNEQGLRIADKLIWQHSRQVYGTAHWKDLPKDWMTTDTYKKKFYDEEELERDPYGMQRLDRVAGSARGMLIMKHLESDHLVRKEYDVLKKEVSDPENLCQTELVRNLLDEGPLWELKMEEGEEIIRKADKWNVHKTLVIFFYITGFRAKSEKEQEEWFYCLMDAMKNDPTNRAALHFLNKNYAEELDERQKERNRRRLQEFKGLKVDEKGVGNTIVTNIRPQKNETAYNPDADETNLVLRVYQEELVQPALEGKNCVIVGPTGCGKTEVAIYAALNHLRERQAAGQTGRVAMLVPKIPLVTQQKERFLQYCRGSFTVNGFFGSEKSDSGEGRKDDVIESHIVVMTPQILINMLQSVRVNERLYVADFSMMIFDEVHKATGNHPYVIINQIVQEWEHDKPQIIGLTASLNVSSTAQKDLSQMLFSIHTMLALLNAPYLSTIKLQASIDELNKHVSKPDDSVEVCQPTATALRNYIETYLGTAHIKLCHELESLSKLRHNCFPSNSYRRFKKLSPKFYEIYESNLQNINQDLKKLNTAEKTIAVTWMKYIRLYVEARGMVDLMPARLVFEFMEARIRELDTGHKLGDQFSDFFKKYSGLEANAKSDEPMIVTKLKDTLITQFKVTPDSRVIIFVTQRATAQRISDFLNKSHIMDQFRDPDDDGYDEMVGFVLGTNNQGGAVQQSQQEQQKVLSRFNNGKMKVIVATSVVEEGLDVTSCNLIIKYNCSSGSAIQLVQRRGRARAKNSRSVLLAVNTKVNEDENNALISEKFMRMCVKKIEEAGPKQLEIDVAAAAKKIAIERKNELTAQLELRERFANSLYKLNCVGCSTTFCMSSDIKKVYSNYMAFDPAAWQFFTVESKKKKPNSYLSEDTQPLSILKCAKCVTTVIGKAYKMRGVYLPQIDVKSVFFVEENSSESKTAKKWSSVEQELFYVGEATQDNFEDMLNALSNNECNMDKKRLLDLDSKQHIRDIELKKYRIRNEEQEKAKAERMKKAEQEGVEFEEGEEPEPEREGATAFSEDES
ncbi:hypothetical protein CAEBREN_20187 [Caenorhabditis brenneri]|uniref:RNA helicase n=1 Tax=Caenorhabditis brenneri TaxID=135651 RepID=G0MFE9_CAEBE|nr:hypothetical protein CAEBREN_20187 [Caenorhabditis brenneri]